MFESNIIFIIFFIKLIVVSACARCQSFAILSSENESFTNGLNKCNSFHLKLMTELGYSVCSQIARSVQFVQMSGSIHSAYDRLTVHSIQAAIKFQVYELIIVLIM